MSTMIEKVAKAICPWAGRKHSSCPKECSVCTANAYAAIEAMREPTDEMVNQYFKIRKASGDTDISACFNVSLWETSIDAALDNGK